MGNVMKRALLLTALLALVAPTLPAAAPGATAMAAVGAPVRAHAASTRAFPGTFYRSASPASVSGQPQAGAGTTYYVAPPP